jgi:formaldehyde-activating enzyme involved in methanogenesis
MPDASVFNDVVLAIVSIEFVALALWRLQTGKGPSLAKLAPNLAAGACLLMVARSALNDQNEMMLVWLAAAGLAHTIDLVQRFR